MTEPEPEPTADAAPVRASVIIPTRGGRDRLHHPLDALRRQSIEDFEVIVVVDGDVDDTAGLLETYRREGMTRLRSIVFPQNRGRSAALNAGFDAARGQILIRCDDDLEPGPEYVQRHLEAHPDPDGLSGVIGLYDNRYPETPYARVYGRPMNTRFRQDAEATPAGRQWRYWAGNCSVTRHVHDLVGGYDRDYRRYGWEDVDMGWRLAQAGADVRIEPGLLTPHHVAATTTASRARRALHSGAARELFLAKHGQEALGPQRRPAGLWGAAVRGLAAVLTETRLERIAGGVDRILPRIPEGLGRKLVALCVEAAGHAGERHPDRARRTF